MQFASDNTAPVAPEVMASLLRANEGYCSSYGSEAAMTRVQTRLREIFEAPQARVYLVATGTAANALSLATLCPPWGAIYAHRHAHIEEDECGAPEFFTNGAKLLHVEGDNAKMTPMTLTEALGAVGASVHQVQKAALSVSNVTEFGTLYTPDEIAALTSTAHARGLRVHMDGARFTNALEALSCTPAELSWKAGIDILCLGGTKNGLMGAEAVVIFDPELAWEFELRRKRAGHLFSKHRYLSAQIEAWLENDLWRDLARRANARGQKLAQAITNMGATLLYPAQSNLMFARWARAGHRAAQAAGAQYHLEEGAQLHGDDTTQLSARLVCSWSTTEAEIDQFAALISPPASN